MTREKSERIASRNSMEANGQKYPRNKRRKFTVPIHGALLGGAHVGAGLGTAMMAATASGMAFYRNGTTKEVSTS
ncbi:hypothetical protein AAE478_005066 [Parahypoxylon ruwenzoriense]